MEVPLGLLSTLYKWKSDQSSGSRQSGCHLAPQKPSCHLAISALPTRTWGLSDSPLSDALGFTYAGLKKRSNLSLTVALQRCASSQAAANNIPTGQMIQRLKMLCRVGKKEKGKERWREKKDSKKLKRYSN